MASFPSLRLHNRLAILLPTHAMREALRPALYGALRSLLTLTQTLTLTLALARTRTRTLTLTRIRTRTLALTLALALTLTAHSGRPIPRGASRWWRLRGRRRC